MKIIRGRKALVTGAASGIGRAIALALAAQGADLFLVDIDCEGLEATKREALRSGGAVHTAVRDLADPAEVSALVAALASAWDRLNILVNSAGIAHHGPTHEMPISQWNRLIAVNLHAPVQLTLALLPTLLAADEANIVNICSIYGLVTRRRMAAYQTSKFGLVGFTFALHTEYRSPRFGVTAVCPGFVRTPMLDRNAGDRHLPGWGAPTPPGGVAARVISAIRGNQRQVIITGLARFFWICTRLSPGLVDWFSRKGWKRRQ